MVETLTTARDQRRQQRHQQGCLGPLPLQPVIPKIFMPGGAAARRGAPQRSRRSRPWLMLKNGSPCLGRERHVCDPEARGPASSCERRLQPAPGEAPPPGRPASRANTGWLRRSDVAHADVSLARTTLAYSPATRSVGKKGYRRQNWRPRGKRGNAPRPQHSGQNAGKGSANCRRRRPATGKPPREAGAIGLGLGVGVDHQDRNLWLGPFDHVRNQGPAAKGPQTLAAAPHSPAAPAGENHPATSAARSAAGIVFPFRIEDHPLSAGKNEKPPAARPADEGQVGPLCQTPPPRR